LALVVIFWGIGVSVRRDRGRPIGPVKRLGNIDAAFDALEGTGR
jgi:hypothetical protein